MVRMWGRVLFIVLSAAAVVRAGGFCVSSPVVSSNVVTANGLTIVPFAVPVAVPVATLANPPLMYSYQQQAGVAASTSVTTSTATVTVPKATVEPASDDPTLIFRRHCVECHRGSSAQGKLSLFDAAGSLLDKLPRHVIVDAIIPDENGRAAMPPTGRPRLTADEVRTLRRWATSSRDVVF